MTLVGQPLSSLDDIRSRNVTDLCGILYLVLILGLYPLAVAFITTLELEHAPGGTPLPWCITGTLTEARRGLPLAVDPVVDPILVFPSVLTDDAGNCTHQHRVGSDCQLEVNGLIRTLALGIGDTGSLTRIQPDGLHATLNRRFDELRIDNGLGLVWIGTMNLQYIRTTPVIIRWTEVIETGITETWR